MINSLILKCADKTQLITQYFVVQLDAYHSWLQDKRALNLLGVTERD